MKRHVLTNAAVLCTLLVVGFSAHAASDRLVRQTTCGDVGVSRFGSTFVYDGAPDLMRDAPLQEGNGSPVEKVRPTAMTSRPSTSNCRSPRHPAGSSPMSP